MEFQNKSGQKKSENIEVQTIGARWFSTADVQTASLLSEISVLNVGYLSFSWLVSTCPFKHTDKHNNKVILTFTIFMSCDKPQWTRDNIILSSTFLLQDVPAVLIAKLIFVISLPPVPFHHLHANGFPKCVVCLWLLWKSRKLIFHFCNPALDPCLRVNSFYWSNEVQSYHRHLSTLFNLWWRFGVVWSGRYYEQKLCVEAFQQDDWDQNVTGLVHPIILTFWPLG